MADRSPPSFSLGMRPMDSAMIDEHLENIDRRLTKLEQVLPTLATKQELQLAVEPLATKEQLQRAIEPLATKEELRLAIEPLATKEELRLAIEQLATKEDLKAYATKEDLKAYATKEDLREEGERSRRHMEVLTESLRGDIHLIAEHVASALSKRDGS
jgi:ribosomal protein L23